jgi:hypothetical protein
MGEFKGAATVDLREMAHELEGGNHGRFIATRRL